MRNIYTAIDLGSNSIKIVVAEYINDKYHVLASNITKIKGVRRGLIVDFTTVDEYLKIALAETEKKLGFKITKALISVPSFETKITVEEAKVKVEEETVSNRDVTNVLDKAALAIELKHELIAAIPISFSLDKKNNIKKPQNQAAKNLGVKAIVISSPRQHLQEIFALFNDNNIEIIDIFLKSVADYNQVKDNYTEKSLGALINIGEDIIDIALFNKGIIIKEEQLRLGSRNVDRDIAYVYGLDLSIARNLKEKLSYATKKLADNLESVNLPALNGGTINISQKEVSEIVEARIREMLKLSKNIINDLTKRKISYIIVTGGLTQIPGMDNLIEEEFGIDGKVVHMKDLGVRDNRYLTAMGMIRAYREKLEFRGQNYSMINDEELNQMMSLHSIDYKDVEEDRVINASDYFIQ